MDGTRRRLIGGMVVLAALAVGVAAAGWGGGAAATEAQGGDNAAIAELQDAAGNTVGHVTFTRQGDGVRVQAEAYGLPPGFHGFHVHATGACDPSTSAAFTSAGGHFDRGGHDHAHHAGDMPVLYIRADGAGSLSFVADAFAVTTSSTRTAAP